jgi:hypothetical protein
MNRNICALALLCVTAGVSAQTIYRQVDDEGRITFSDQPPERPAALPRRGVNVEANEAARRLKQAQLERERGAAPRPGELVRAGRHPAVNYSYWRRQEKLRILVERAQHRMNATHRLQIAAPKSASLRLAASRAEEVPEDQAQNGQ